MQIIDLQVRLLNLLLAEILLLLDMIGIIHFGFQVLGLVHQLLKVMITIHVMLTLAIMANIKTDDLNPQMEQEIRTIMVTIVDLTQLVAEIGLGFFLALLLIQIVALITTELLGPFN